VGKIGRTKGAKNKIKRPVHPGSENLINLRDRTPEERRRIGALGGAASAKTRSLVMKLKYLKKKGMNDETMEKLYEIMTDDSMSSLDILVYINQLRSKLSKPEDKLKMAKLLMDWHKSRHGEKQQKQEIEVYGAAGIKVIFEEPTKNEEKPIND